MQAPAPKQQVKILQHKQVMNTQQTKTQESVLIYNSILIFIIHQLSSND
jgi:hypothetical protein